MLIFFQAITGGGRREDHVWSCYGPAYKAAGKKGMYRGCRGCGHAVPTTTLSRALNAGHRLILAFLVGVLFSKAVP